MDLNVHPVKEFLILVMGPIFQTLTYYILLFLSIDLYKTKMIHYGILCFNLLPIYPLDGGKLLNIILNNFFPFQKTFQLSIIISYIVTVLVLIQNKKVSINMILTYIVLIWLIRKEENKKIIYYKKFLLERLLKNFPHKKNIIIEKENDFYRYRNNWMKEGNHLIKEKDYLKRKYEFFGKKY